MRRMHALELDALAELPPRAPRLPLQWTGAEQPFGTAEPALLQALHEAGTPFDPGAAPGTGGHGPRDPSRGPASHGASRAHRPRRKEPV